MKLYVLSVMFSADQKAQKPYLLTSSKHENILPLFEIKYPQFFQKEIFQHLKSIFTKDSIEVASECSYNFLDIQEQLSVQYVKDNYDFVKEDDLIVTYGGVILKYRCLEGFKWSEYSLKTQHDNGSSPDINLSLLLDYVIQRTAL